MKPRLVVAAVLAATAIGGFVLLPKFRNRPVQLVGVTQIRLSVWDMDGPTNSISINSSNEIAAILSTIRLKPKEPCVCMHMREIHFETDTTPMSASICDHCFDLYRSNHVENYWMPPMFWKLVKEKIPHERW